VRTRDDSISFHVSRPGVPVVVRTSYFPNWEADGARGPWRLTPNLMVVVPTGTSVALHYARTGAEWTGIALSVVGVLALGGLVWWDRRRDGEPAEGTAGAAPAPAGAPPDYDGDPAFPGR
jgi:hypothetical protein